MKLIPYIRNYWSSHVKMILMLLAVVCLLSSCDFLSKNDSYNNGFRAGYLEGLKDGKEQSQPTNKSTDKVYTNPDHNPPPAVAQSQTTTVSNPAIPQKAVLVLDFIRKNNKSPEGYVGGRHFGNFEHNLPERDAAGSKIEYQEWDIQPKVEGRSRGAQRVVTGSDGRAWYTPDHYSTFTEIK